MGTCRRCIKEDGGSTYHWQCSRRSHPVQRMGGVCAMCLTERLSNISRCAEATRPPRLTDQASCGSRRLAAASHESMDSAPNHKNMLIQGNYISVQQSDNYIGVQEVSARHSSAGSEQSIASLIEREIDEAGRQRYSDVTAGFSTMPLKELAQLESSNERRAAACAKQQLARSKSYSTNSHVTSMQSTPASNYSSLLSGGDSAKLYSSRTDSNRSSNFRRCNTIVAAAHAVEKNSNHALLTKSKSTGSNYNRHGANKLRSPIHAAWHLPNFWHKKCNHMQETRCDSSYDDHSLVLVQADGSVPFMKLPHSSNKDPGAANCINQDTMCLGKWLNRSSPSSFHLTRRRTTSSKTLDVAASSSSSAASRSNCSPDLQVVDDRCAKGVSICGRWRLPSFNVSRKSALCRASTIDFTPELGVGIISAADQSSNFEQCEMPDIFDDQDSNSRGHKVGTERDVAGLVSTHLQNVEESADNECNNEEGKADECNIDGAAVIRHDILRRDDTADSRAGSANKSRSRGSGHLLNIGSQFSFRSRVECTHTIYSGHTKTMQMHPYSRINQYQSIAALVSMDASRLIR